MKSVSPLTGGLALKKKINTRTLLLCAASLLFLHGHAAARTFMSGSAELAYVDYDSKGDNTFPRMDITFSGHSFAQKYSLAFTATNLYHRTQLQYYNVSLGYDWLAYDTEFSTNSTTTSIKDDFGKFRYNGEAGYNPRNLPIKLRIFAEDSSPLTLVTDVRGANENVLLSDGLYRGIDGKLQANSRGFSFEFDPDFSRTVFFRGLPKMNLDYRESFYKSDSTDSYAVDFVTKELSAAGLTKGDNSVIYRNLDYQDRINNSNSYKQQKLQIGHVNIYGQRLWNSLTSWIEVSADGQFTDRKGSQGDFTETYDVNLFARATRRSWNVLTLASFTRELSKEIDSSVTELVEQVRVPVYVKGVYGPDTTWYTSVSFVRGTQNLNTPAARKDSSYSNTVGAGATAFARSAFTLSPSFSVSTSKGFTGTDSLDLRAAVEANSTSRYSRRLGLAARAELNYLDDGSESITSKIWNGSIGLKANYLLDSKTSLVFEEKLEAGEETVDWERGLKQYVRSFTSASAAWTPTADFSTSVQGNYDWRKNETTPAETDAHISHRLLYSKKHMSFTLASKYIERQREYTKSKEAANSGSISYKPDRYNKGALSYSYTFTQSGNVKNSYTEALQSYSYNFFARTGENRNLGELSEEIGYRSNKYGISRINETGDASTSTRWLAFRGRYSPLAKLALYGSVRYAKEDPGSVVISYGAGMNADFKLLTTSLDYAYARRDSDNRIEKRFSASVRRTF